RGRADRRVGSAGGLLLRALDEEHVFVRAAHPGAGAAAAGPDGTPRMIALWRDMPARGRALAGLLLVLLLAAPLFADRYLLSVLILIFYFAYLGQAWNLMMGFAGQLSLGHALQVGLGAYVAAMLWVYFGIGPWLGVVPAVAVAALLGAAIAWLGCRFSIEGVYFALLTIAFAEFTRIAFDHIGAAGGAGGFFVPYQAEHLGEWWNLRGGQWL